MKLMSTIAGAGDEAIGFMMTQQDELGCVQPVDDKLSEIE